MKLPPENVFLSDLKTLIYEKSNKEIALMYGIAISTLTNFMYEHKLKRDRNKLLHKRCSICHIDKDISQFRLRGGKPRADCIECQYQKSKKHYEENRDYILQYGKSARSKELNKIRKRKRFFYFKAAKFIQTYNARLNKNDLALFLWHQWHRQKGLCAITGRKLDPDKCQIDHIIPRTKDLVINDFNNLRWTCKEGNYFKCNMTDDVFLELVKDVYNHMILPKIS